MQGPGWPLFPAGRGSGKILQSQGSTISAYAVKDSDYLAYTVPGIVLGTKLARIDFIKL